LSQYKKLNNIQFLHFGALNGGRARGYSTGLEGIAQTPVGGLEGAVGGIRTLSGMLNGPTPTVTAETPLAQYALVCSLSMVQWQL
jgi:hypothetical protein